MDSSFSLTFRYKEKLKKPKDITEKIIEIYKGTYNEFSQSVALNAAAGLIVAGKENNFKIAFKKTSEHLNSGKVFEYLTKLQSK